MTVSIRYGSAQSRNRNVQPSDQESPATARLTHVAYRSGERRSFSPRPEPAAGTLWPGRPARRLFFRQCFLPSFLLPVPALVLSPAFPTGRPRLDVFASEAGSSVRDGREPPARKSQLLRKFLLLDSGGRLFRNLVRGRGLWLSFFSGSRFRMAFLC
jgi:hypothetical protein